METNKPCVTMCAEPEKQKNVFDLRVTGVDAVQMPQLRTQIEACGYQWLDVGKEAADIRVVTIGCASGRLLTADGDIPMIEKAIESAGMQLI